MPYTVTMPKLSPTMEIGTIVSWHKKEGEFIEPGETLLEVATDKATVEHEAIDPGFLRKILIHEGQEAEVNQAIAIFTATKEEGIEGYQAEPIKPEKSLPQREESVEKVSIQKSEKIFEKREMPRFEPAPPQQNYVFNRRQELVSDKIKASPLARRLAKEKGFELAGLVGSGPGNRIMKKDLEKAVSTGMIPFTSFEVPKEIPGSYEELPLTPMRKTIGQRLQDSKSYIPHFYVRQTIDADPVFQIREQLKKLEFKVTYNDLVIKASALALREHSVVNSGFNSVNQTLIQFKTIDISVAVSVEGGLITPIIRHADYKTVFEISAEVKALAIRAKEGQLEEHEYKGGSFTVSNLGMFGITEFQGIINPPQAALIAVSGIQEAPVVRKENVVVGKTMNLSLSADHRVVDGVAAAKFLKTLQFYLENPISLFI